MVVVVAFIIFDAESSDIRRVDETEEREEEAVESEVSSSIRSRHARSRSSSCWAMRMAVS